MKIAICDDNADDRAAIKHLLMEYATRKSCDFDYMEYESGQTLLTSIESDSTCPEPLCRCEAGIRQI